MPSLEEIFRKVVNQHFDTLNNFLDQKDNYASFLEKFSGNFIPKNLTSEERKVFAILLMERIRRWRNSSSASEKFSEVEKTSDFKNFLKDLLGKLEKPLPDEEEELRLAKFGLKYIQEENAFDIQENFFDQRVWEKGGLDNILDHLRNYQSPFFNSETIKKIGEVIRFAPDKKFQLDFWLLMSSWLDQETAISKTEAFSFAKKAFSENSYATEARQFVGNKIKYLVTQEQGYQPLLVYSHNGGLRLETSCSLTGTPKTEEELKHICKAFVSFVTDCNAILPCEPALKDFLSTVAGTTEAKKIEAVQILLNELQDGVAAKAFIEKVFCSLDNILGSSKNWEKCLQAVTKNNVKQALEEALCQKNGNFALDFLNAKYLKQFSFFNPFQDRAIKTAFIQEVLDNPCIKKENAAQSPVAGYRRFSCFSGEDTKATQALKNVQNDSTTYRGEVISSGSKRSS